MIESLLRKDVLPKARKGIKRTKLLDEKPISDSIIPGTQKIYIKTWGCSHNNSDSEYMAGQLAAYGYKIIGWCTKVLTRCQTNVVNVLCP